MPLLTTSMADLNRAKSDAERAKLDYDRAPACIATNSSPSRTSTPARRPGSQPMPAWRKPWLASPRPRRRKIPSDKRITQNSANLTRVSDVLKKTTYEAPFDGVITNLPVREGETVVIGIQNSPGSTLMTIADMSVITSEVKVDETDIVNVKLGQSAEVTIDAIPRKVFHGIVTEIGNNAIVRSTGVATSQQSSTSQEAKDFKVVVTLTDPPEDLRPGLSSTAKITTATPQQRAQRSHSGAHDPHSRRSGNKFRRQGFGEGGQRSRSIRRSRRKKSRASS